MTKVWNDDDYEDLCWYCGVRGGDHDWICYTQLNSKLEADEPERTTSEPPPK